MAIRHGPTDPRIGDPELFHKHGLTSYLGVPLIAHDKVLGVISFFTKEEHDFSGEEIDFFSTLAAQAAIAIQNSQLYEEIKTQAVQLEKSNKIKMEFLSVMSHELRTPLHSVIGYTWMLRDRLLGEISREQDTAVNNILRRAEDLLGMINSIMEATKIEAGATQMESHELDLHEFIHDLSSAYDIPFGKTLTLVWDYPPDLPRIRIDGGKLKHILQNLVNNAVKFTAEGHVTVSVRCSPATRTIKFEVTDTGIGIPAEALPSIFDMFRQLDSSETRSYGGVGLGLYIVKRFTEILGGAVEVQSAPDKGSAFTVTLPYESAGEQMESSQRTSAGGR
jgi:signal transduction histidine kinase